MMSRVTLWRGANTTCCCKGCGWIDGEGRFPPHVWHDWHLSRTSATKPTKKNYAYAHISVPLSPICPATGLSWAYCKTSAINFCGTTSWSWVSRPWVSNQALRRTLSTSFTLSQFANSRLTARGQLAVSLVLDFRRVSNAPNNDIKSGSALRAFWNSSVVHHGWSSISFTVFLFDCSFRHPQGLFICQMTAWLYRQQVKNIFGQHDHTA